MRIVPFLFRVEMLNLCQASLLRKSRSSYRIKREGAR